MSRTLPFNPYEGVSSARQSELNNYATALMERYGGDGVLNFTEFGSMLYDISGANLNTTEKCNVWTTIAGRLNEYSISNVGLKPDNIDSFRPGSAAGHIVIGFNDGYHCPLANLPYDDAFTAIINHEQNEGGLRGSIARNLLSTPVIGHIISAGTLGHLSVNDSALNDGDATASLNQVIALKGFLNGGFAGYAKEWNRVFIGR